MTRYDPGLYVQGQGHSPWSSGKFAVREKLTHHSTNDPSYLAQMSTITRQCVMYKIKVHMSKGKVTYQGQTENSFIMQDLSID